MPEPVPFKLIEGFVCLAGLAFFGWVLAAPLQFAARSIKPGEKVGRTKARGRKDKGKSKNSKVRSKKVLPHQARWAGTGKCRACHPKIASAFASTNKSRSILPLAAAATVERSGKLATTGLAQYLVAVTPGRMIHRESVKDRRGGILIDHAVQLRLAFGSGSTGRAYLTEADGQFRVSALAWHRNAPHWRLLPGYEVDDPRRFEAELDQECWSCHTSRRATKDKKDRALNPFVAEALNCESCHGPFADHIETKRDKTTCINVATNILKPG